MNRLFIIALFAAIATCSCLPTKKNKCVAERDATIPQYTSVQSGGVKMIPVMGGKYKVWTKKVGDGKIKVLLLHGGPGLTHEYFECMESYFPQAGIEFYYYDQLGSKYSDHPTDTALWSV